MKFDKLVESIFGKNWDIDDVIANPAEYTLQFETMDDEDYDGNLIQRTVAYVYKNGDYRNYERIDCDDDIDKVREAFERLNQKELKIEDKS